MNFLRRYSGIIVVMILIIANIFIFYADFYRSSAGLVVAFLDIGQGDAIYIKSPTGTELLVDGGPDGKVLSRLSEIMPFYDREIDLVMASHPDKDHIGGIPLVMERYEVGRYLESEVESEKNAVDDEIEKVVINRKIKKVNMRRGMKIDLGGGVVLHILFPDRDSAGLDTNDASIVAKLVYGTTSFLFTGDSPEKIEDYLLYLDGTILDSDVLKVGHHGSNTSTDNDFVEMVTPTYAVISAGKDNSYGHPHKEVLDTLEKSQSQILTTAELGTIIMKSNSQQITLQ